MSGIFRVNNRKIPDFCFWARKKHRNTTCLPEIRFIPGRYPAITWFCLSQNNSEGSSEFPECRRKSYNLRFLVGTRMCADKYKKDAGRICRHEVLHHCCCLASVQGTTTLFRDDHIESPCLNIEHASQIQNNSPQYKKNRILLFNFERII